ncbi:MAG TPA: tRNA pseudouridine(38-40) synthase TruA [Vicinamibacterales bacterium]|jgi:tRNA pseudouridine38-40 synthase|nr:tRNA pseudouridine(38-40) synthase TruA [Vicinamibacterales bacterium]
MRTFKIMLSYDGTDFGGFQRQSNARSVQQVLEEALAPIEGADVIVSGAGRTDAGVHALGQVASCRLSGRISPGDLKKALNATLSATGSNDVRVLAVEEAADDFNARFSARAKLYRYRIVNAELVSPFDRRYAWHVPRALNLDNMREAARTLAGEHDFAAFQSAGNKATTSIRTITSSEWTETPLAGGGRLLTYEIAGGGFLKYMVRAIIGTFVDIGTSRRPVDSMERLLVSGNRGDAGPTAPPHGLYLVRVDYDAAAPVSFS